MSQNKSTYNHEQIENKWREVWMENNLYKAEDFSDKPKKYILAELPYPSGKALHAGHMMRYTVPDVYARYLRMNGYNVLFPMGWDAFGLPAENYAVKTGIHPEKTTKEIIHHYKETVPKMGYGIDWSREVSTIDPNYYKWTQWIFLKFWKAGLAEYKKMPIWWCEKLRTVLSDEEILTDKDGNKISERGEHPVEKKMLSQWVLKIPEYADKLIAGLDTVDFPDAIKLAQINWIGKSNGADVQFELNDETVEVFTTRPDTLFGVTFMAMAPEHPLTKQLIESCSNKKDVTDYIEWAKNRSELERQQDKTKTGVLVQGVMVKHPLSEINKEIPLYIADYVLMDYGTGVVMGVPAHDERDNEFAKKYGIEIIEVIKPNNENNEGTMINSGSYDGMPAQEFFKTIITRLENEGKGKAATTYKIRDWVFSRQRYWGEPIPLVHKSDGTIEAVCDPDNMEEVNAILPVTLPEVPDYNPSEDGTSPLERNVDWVNTTAKDGTPAKRETNTMPNWAGSCWYFMRYIDPHNNNEFADKKKLEYWLPVDRYFGGAEHTTMHLLYSRFWQNFLYDQGVVPQPEPFAWRMNGGLLLGPDGRKMSKSIGNVIEPMDVVQKFGADALRMFICFLGPYTDTYPWNDAGVKRTNKLVRDIYAMSDLVEDSVQMPDDIMKAYHKLVKNVTGMIEDLKMNTSISELMIFVNKLKETQKIDLDLWKGFIKVLAPFAPFVAEEIWHKTVAQEEWTRENSVHLQKWPEYDNNIVADDYLTIPVQINGKVRGEVKIAAGSDEDTVKKLALEQEDITRSLEDKEILKVIYIQDKIINLVV